MEIIQHRRDRFSEANLSVLQYKQSASIQIRTPRSQCCGQVNDPSLPKNCVIVKIIQHCRDRFSEANLSVLQYKQSASIQIRTPRSQRCGQVTDLSLPKNCAIMEIIQHRRDRFSEANLSALSMQNPNSNPGIAALRTGH
jgi:hypothetical protein